MAFKSSTVNSSKVAASLSNFPSYFEPSRIGITTLAQAQSSRFYADSGKVTEWAREVVSATEIHTKITSLTTSTVAYCDYDGIRSDYAVTDTYGRNAVWSDYRAVWHLKDGTDSTGNGYTMSTYGSGTSYGASKIGDGALTSGLNGLFAHRGTVLNSTQFSGGFSFGYWIKITNTASTWFSTIMRRAGSPYYQSWNYFDNATSEYRYHSATTFPVVKSTGTVNTFYKQTLVHSGSGNATLYQNGASVATGSGLTGASSPYNDQVVLLGTDSYSVGTSNAAGTIDEARISINSSHSTANWILTEYNNQNDESTFWGSWADVGGAVQNSNFLMFMS